MTHKQQYQWVQIIRIELRYYNTNNMKLYKSTIGSEKSLTKSNWITHLPDERKGVELVKELTDKPKEKSKLL